LVTLKDIAKECGCDISTVSRALQNSPRVRASTIEKVKAATEKLGYAPNIAAQALARGKSMVISFLVPTLVSETENLPAMYISEFLVPHKYDLIICQYHESDEMILRQLRRADQGAADGLIIVSSEFSLSSFEKHLSKIKTPYIFLDRHCPGIEATTITSANNQAAISLIEKLSTEGIDGYIHFFSRENSAENERKAGFISAVGKTPFIHEDEDLYEFIKTNKVKKLCLCSSAQEFNQMFVKSNAELLKGIELYSASFDHWHGAVHPFQKAYVARQDWQTISVKAVDKILGELSGKQHYNEIIKIPFLSIDEIN
jgi:DNA-binding LacI/PurR family transcriptional regulator